MDMMISDAISTDSIAHTPSTVQDCTAHAPPGVGIEADVEEGVGGLMGGRWGWNRSGVRAATIG